ncbi:type I polyketide synthase [Chthonobacter rhizosphaerae]|uniref:type I polyketide synthase n=1 Tax=Chthonobacter rhizosphaerae TaxID=2735553 RepID=UPI0015EE3ED1|nr:type I polyketide synthase [Chthonobacter rhizosphaerae]
MTSTPRDIAIVGYACRLPQADTADEFWSILERGECVVGEIQPGRWALNRFGHRNRKAAGKSYTWRAGQLDDPWGFDPTFFGISPREAIQMDPQQRILLQVVWEALEHAGLPASRLAGTETGVYVGASSVDYSNRFVVDPSAMDIQMMTGNTLSIVSNRISYIFDLKGPSFTVDTACSSSVVALHEALEAMRSGRIDTAIVGGVNMLLSPFAFVGFSRASMLSPTGLCRAFDADGDGYVRSEGAVAFVLKTMDAARAAGDPIRGVLVGSGINSDGRTVGMSLPSAQQQAALLRHVYDRFEIDPAGLAYIEAHGTGTRVGDPAEAQALGEILGRKRGERLPVGSVKTNIGHLEAASGMAGLLKAQLVLEKAMVPPSLHFNTPNPDIPFDDLNIEVVTAARPLPATGTPLHVGVNSFGFGGANAHAVIRQPAPHEVARERAPGKVAPLVVSAQSPDALKALAADYRSRLDDADTPAAARIANAAAFRRDRLDHRLVVLGGTADELRDGLDRWLAGERGIDHVSGRATARTAPVAFVFSGNGSQWAGMGLGAYQSDAAFRTAFDTVTRLFMRIAGWSLLTTLFSEDLETDIERTEVAQPLLFAIQVATVEALAVRGLKPDMVAGHSVGEVAAAWAAGALSLESAVFLIHVRSTQQEVTRHLGGMAALLVPLADARKALSENGFSDIEIAADNSPRSLTLSGTNEQIAEFAKVAKKNRWAMRKLKLDYPFHCALIDPIRQPLVKALATLQPHETRLPYVSAVTGDVVEGAALSADYWWRNVRQPVLFRQAVERLSELGAKVFVEIGPKPVLQAYVTDSLAGVTRPGVAVPTLDKADETGGDVIGHIVARALVEGARIDDSRFFGAPAAVDVDLPRYAWQNQPFRIDHTDEAADVFGAGDDHPILGFRMRRGSGPWIAAIDADIVPWLADHKVESSTVFPAAGFVEAALAAAAAVFGGAPVEIRDFDILRPLVLEADEPVELRTEVDPDRHVVEISSRRRLNGDDFALHVRARIARPPVATADPVAVPAPTGESLGADALYDLTRRFGLDYGPAFQRAVSVTPIDDRSLFVALSADQADSLDDAGMVLHPTLLDASFHGLFYLIQKSFGAAGDSAYLPVRIGDLRVYTPGATPAGAIVTVTKASPRSVEASFTLVAADGAVVARATGVRFKAVLLSRAADPDEFVLTTTALRLADETDAVELPESWADPAARLAALGLSAPEPEDLDDGALLVDAGSRALAYEAAARFAKNGLIDPAALVAEGALAASALPLLNRLIDALDEDGAVERSDAGVTLAAESPYPTSDAVIATLVAAHPQRIAEATALVRLQADLPRRLAEGLATDGAAPLGAGLADHLETTAPVTLALNEGVATAALDLAASWSADRALRILLVGPEAAALSRRLAAVPTVGTIVVTDPQAGRVDRIRLDLASGGVIEVADFDRIAGAGEPRLFDLAILCDLLGRPDGNEAVEAVAAHLSSGAVVLSGEADPSLFADLTLGLSARWWADSVDPSYPVGPRRTGAGHASSLATLGFTATTAVDLVGGSTRASLIVARAPLRTAVAPEAPQDPILVLVDREPASRAFADAFAATVAAEGRPVRVAVARRATDGRYALEAVDAGSDADLHALISGSSVKDLVYAPSPSTAGEADALDAAEARVLTLHGVLNGGMKPPARLWIVAPGGSGMAGRTARPVETAVWGLGRVLMNEYPDIETRLVDLAVAFSPAEAASRLDALLAAPGAERELVVDERGAAAVRIVSGPSLTTPALAATIDGPAGRTLAIERQGTLDGLVWRTVARRAPQADEVEIEVAAAGLNFRDVMWALGLLPEEALEDGFAGATLGMECSGVITRVGPAVRRFKPGDRVISFAPACFATHVVVAEKALAPVPSTVDLEAAATIPVTFLTAWYALVELARLEEGETVVIHGGAGGVGLAALQIALSRGARVIATAGSPDKRRLLSMLGAAHVLDSRSLAFADEVMALTDGKGADVVLNSLFGEAMERSLEVLKPFGRFVELGKRDYYANTRIGLRPFRQNLSYFGVDADQLLTRRPKLTEQLFRDLVESFEAGVLTALPYRVFKAERITEAFRLMQQSGHIGKILVLPPEAPAKAVGRPARITGDGTYIVAGGLGGFGVETAKMLVRRGARSIVLTSRSGTVSPVAAEAIAHMEAAGARVLVTATDITSRDAVDALLARIRADLPPLKGVLHTAMVLDDALFQNLDGPRMRAVMAPKIAGAAVLDAATRGEDLDLFVLYSSATTLIGNPGQAPYVAANAYLEGLARARRAAGLPALAIAWGAIADAGYLARNADVNDMLSMRLGKQALTAKAALAGLELALDAGLDQPVIAYARIDWAAARRELAIMQTPLAARVAVAAAEAQGDGAGDGQLASLIEGLDHGAAVKLVTESLAGEISRILRLPVEDIDPSRPLTEIGMDSLMALELRMAAEQRFGIDIPLLSLANGAALGDIARRIVDKAGAAGGDDAASADSELAAARHVGEEMDDELAAVVSAIEAQSTSVKRLTG